MKTTIGFRLWGPKTEVKGLRIARIIFASAVILLGFLAIVSMIYNYTVYRGMISYNLSLDRDPKTGVIRGCEAREIQPPEGIEARGTVIMIHGFSSSPQDFGTLPDEIAEAGFTVNLLRIDGHGTSPEDLAGTNQDKIEAEIVLKILSTDDRTIFRGGKPLFIVGFSIGGPIALQVYKRLPLKPDGLIFLAPYFSLSRRWWLPFTPDQMAKLTGRYIPYVSRVSGFRNVNDPDAKGKYFTYEYLSASSIVMLEEIAARGRRDAAVLKGICPVCLIHSKNDKVASYDDAVKMVNKMSPKSTTIVTLEKSNHILCWDYERDIVTQKVLEFLNECAARMQAPEWMRH